LGVVLFHQDKYSRREMIWVNYKSVSISWQASGATMIIEP
jgi:hypothetical protein